MKGVGGLFPGKFARPAGQKQHVGFGQLVLAITPRNFFHHHAAASAVHAPHAVQKENQNAPERNELKASLRKMVVTGGWLMAARADSWSPCAAGRRLPGCCCREPSGCSGRR